MSVLTDELVRIGEKIISMPKIEQSIRKILQLRSAGLSQQEVANLLYLDPVSYTHLQF